MGRKCECFQLHRNNEMYTSDEAIIGIINVCFILPQFYSNYWKVWQINYKLLSYILTTQNFVILTLEGKHTRLLQKQTRELFVSFVVIFPLKCSSRDYRRLSKTLEKKSFKNFQIIRKSLHCKEIRNKLYVLQKSKYTAMFVETR